MARFFSFILAAGLLVTLFYVARAYASGKLNAGELFKKLKFPTRAASPDNPSEPKPKSDSEMPDEFKNLINNLRDRSPK